MKFLLLLMTAFSLFGESILLPLGEEGCVRYNGTDGLVHSIERLDKDGAVTYTHSYHYNEDRRLIKEDVMISVVMNKLEDWSFGNGEAQLL